jgi:hypothetical protein
MQLALAASVGQSVVVKLVESVFARSQSGMTAAIRTNCAPQLESSNFVFYQDLQCQN